MRILKMTILALMIGSTTWASNTTSNTAEKSAKSENSEVTTKEDSLEILIHPNPTSDKIFIQSIEQYQMTLSDMDGKILLQKNKTNYLDINNINAGLYILEFKDLNGRHQQQIITIKEK